jgi:hypothetical protein
MDLRTRGGQHLEYQHNGNGIPVVHRNNESPFRNVKGLFRFIL